MKKRKFLLFSVVLVIIVFGSMTFASVSYPFVSDYGPAIVNWGNNVKYGGVLTEVLPSGVQSYNLNPFIGGSVNGLVSDGLIYEPLIYVNLNGDTTYMLGTAYKWEDDNLILAFKIRKNVQWSDGTPFTANDVAFTFNYLKAHPSIDTSGIWSPSNNLASVSASDDTVFFKFSQPDTALLLFIESEPIIPEHIWSNIEDPSKFADTNPVGTGPFIFKSFDPNLNYAIYVKNSNYWMKGRPYLDEVDIFSVNSNTTALLDLISHKADLGNIFIFDPQKSYVAKDPSVNKIWWPLTMQWVMTLNDAKYPFNIPEFRKALSLAINYKQIAESNYPGLGAWYDPALLSYPQKSWLDPALTSLASSLVVYDPQKAQEMLASIGFKKNAAGQLCAPDGKPLPTYGINVVAGWTDNDEEAMEVHQDLEKIGLKTNVNLMTPGACYASLQSGTFDMSPGGSNNMSWTPSPYLSYYTAFSPSLTAPIGQTAVSNFSRYTNPLITAALNIYKSTSDPRLQKQAIYSIERIILDDLPLIPLYSGSMWQEYNTINLVGWPDEDYPYMISYANGAGGEPLYLNVHLK
ncbi:TPA: ABC transporter substrate-binding protein [Candidatus Poribacteria bacterium]|nr:ABC transporter substrate-binding protein [Candidatus Poribacteria bacterium]